MKLISLIVPVYNEEEMLPVFFKKADELFKDGKKYKYEFVVIDDGSKDRTLEIIKEKAKASSRISYLSFSRNFGQEAAVEAGLKAARGEAVIPIDCDFQDPPEVVLEMLKKYEEGYEVVNGKRTSRDEDTLLKKSTAGLFYKLTNWVAGKKVIEENVCYFRLLSRRVVDYVNSLPEAARILRSEVPYVGFKTCDIPFARVSRAAGKTKFNYKKLCGVAAKTVSASTPNLLNWTFKIGVVLGIFSLLGFIISSIVFTVLRGRFFNALLVLVIIFSILLVSSIVALLLSIHSLYLYNIYINVSNRPNYFVNEAHTAESALKIDPKPTPDTTSDFKKNGPEDK